MAYLLIVDDDPDFANAIATICQSLGHEVLTLHAIQQARVSIDQKRPDGIILDVMFPEDPSAGFGLARELGRRSLRIPILMLTAVNQQFPLGFSNKDISDKWLPVAEFLEKPVDFALLREKVNRLFGQPAGAPTK
jgi:DNA-binding response OmpR family regulator